MTTRAEVSREEIAEYPTLREANIARQREWDQDNRISLSYRGNELAGEVGEACNIIKKLDRERLGIRGSRATVEQLAEELADVVICADLIAMGEGINLLGVAVPAKFNATSEKVGLLSRLTAERAGQEPGEEEVERAAKAILKIAPLGYGMTAQQAYDYARAALSARSASPGQHIAILQRHDRSAQKAVLVPAGQALDFDEDTAERRWLRPFTADGWHLMHFLPLEVSPAPQPPAQGEGR